MSRSSLAFVVALLAHGASSCAPPPEPPKPARAPSLAFPSDEAAWLPFRSRRFRMKLRFPDGKRWAIRDHGRPELVAHDERTRSELIAERAYVGELVGRGDCESRARGRGLVPDTLSIVEDAVVSIPRGYDARFVAGVTVGARAEDGVTGHAMLFAAFLRECVTVHLATTANAGEEAVIAQRLAQARRQLFERLEVDDERTGTDLELPRQAPQPRDRR